METVTKLEAASCSQRQVEAAAGPEDARGTQVSHQQEAASPSPQLLPSIEGEGGDAEKCGREGRRDLPTVLDTLSGSTHSALRTLGNCY